MECKYGEVYCFNENKKSFRLTMWNVNTSEAITNYKAMLVLD